MTYFIMIAASMLLGMGVKKKRNIVGVKAKKSAVRNNVIFIVLSALPVFLVSALRYGIGTDYFYTYVPMFNLILKGGRPEYEAGFYYLNKIIAHFTTNSQWLFVITSLMFVACVFWSLYKKAENIPYSLLLFFLSYTFFVFLNNTRQSLASAITLVAVCCLMDGRKKTFLVLTVLAGTIHQSAFIILLYYFVSLLNIPAYIYMLIGVLSFPFAYLIAPRILNLLSRIFPRLYDYQTDKYFAALKGSTLPRLFILINIALLAMIVFVEMNNKRRVAGKGLKTGLDLPIAKLTQFIVVVLCAFDGIVPASYRIVRIFTFFQFLFIPNIIEKNVKNKTNKILLYVFVTVCFAALFYQNYSTGMEEVYPYASIFGR